MGEKEFGWFKYVAIAGLTTFIMANVWSGQRANEVFQKGRDFNEVAYDAEYSCSSKFGLQNEGLCSMLTKPGVWAVYAIRTIEDKLLDIKMELTNLSQYLP